MKTVLPFIVLLTVLAACSKPKSTRIDLSGYSEAEIVTASGAVIHVKSQNGHGDFVAFDAPQEKTHFELWTDQHKLKGWDISEVRDDGLTVQVYAVESLLPKSRISCRENDSVATDTKVELLTWTATEKK